MPCDALGEAAQRLDVSIWHRNEPNTTDVSPDLPLIKVADTLALTDFDRNGHKQHIVYAVPFTARTTDHAGFISFDVYPRITANPSLVGANHPSRQFLENLKDNLIASFYDGIDNGGAMRYFVSAGCWALPPSSESRCSAAQSRCWGCEAPPSGARCGTEFRFYAVGRSSRAGLPT